MSTISCLAPGCEAAVYVRKRQLCRSHYNRWMVYGDLQTPRASGECKYCGESVSRTGAYGLIPDYCTKKCRSDADYKRHRDRRNAEARAEAARVRSALRKVCPQCGETFAPKRRAAQRFCSKQCTNRFHRNRDFGECSADGCSRLVRARSLCSMHWKRWARSEGMIENPKWDDRRRANHHKRRALKLKLPADAIRPTEVYERDGWVCSLCDLPVDRNIAWPDPMSPSLDHVVPLSRGGHHVLENVALAHLECNTQKGNRVESDLVLSSPKG